jgi:uncharacterized tellurite resistance protein B-like protein
MPAAVVAVVLILIAIAIGAGLFRVVELVAAVALAVAAGLVWYRGLRQTSRRRASRVPSTGRRGKAAPRSKTRASDSPLPSASPKRDSTRREEPTSRPDATRWKRAVAERPAKDGVAVVEVARLAEIQQIAQRPRLTVRQSEELARTAQEVGFAIEPDTRVTGRAYSWDDVVALFRTDGASASPGDGRYAGASLMLELGLFVAAADGEVEAVELDHVARFLEAEFRLDRADTRRLEALKRVFLDRHPSLPGLGKRLQSHLTSSQRESVGQFLVGLAAADGAIDKAEIAALRGAYRALGIEAAKLNQLLDDLRRDTSGAAAEPSSEQAAPAPPLPEADGVVTLDPDRLRKILSETQEVARMLGEAMREADEQSDVPEPAPAAPVPSSSAPIAAVPVADARFDGLDARYHPALAELFTRPSWSKFDFEALARRHQLMPSSTLEVINEWSQEKLDDLLIEAQGDDGFRIQTELLSTVTPS